MPIDNRGMNSDFIKYFNLEEYIDRIKLQTYVKRLDNIYFDIEHDTNESINNWFDFILDMADERIYIARTKLETIDVSQIKNIASSEDNIKGTMRLSKIKPKTL